MPSKEITKMPPPLPLSAVFFVITLFVRLAVDRRRPSLSVTSQCKLLDISRSGLYYQPAGISDNDLNLMKLIDRQYMITPFYGTRKMTAWLKSKRHSVNRKHVRRLMQLMGLKAIYRRPRTWVRLLVLYSSTHIRLLCPMAKRRDS